MPGPVVTTATSIGVTPPPSVDAGKLFLVGLTQRGSVTEAIRCRNILEFEDEFGPTVNYSYTHQTAQTFFAEGGGAIYVSRVTGPSPVKSTVTASDRAGSPVPTIRFTAANPGVWGDDIDVVVAAGSGGTITLSVVYSSVTVETYSATTVAGIVSAFADSVYVVATDLASATIAPNNLPANATYNLAGGTDDHTSAVVGQYTTALDRFLPELGTGSVAIPGVGTTVHATLVTHATNNSRIAILGLASGKSKSDHIAAAAAVNSEFAGVFGPWLYAPVDNASTLIPAEGYVAAVRNRAHTAVGSWRVPAGANSVARFVTGLETEWGRVDGDALDAANVNAIRLIAGTVRLYGWNSLSSDSQYALLNIRDLLNYLVVEIDTELEDFVFEPIDGKGHLLSSVKNAVVGVVEKVHIGGGVYDKFDSKGVQVDPGYVVNIGNDINTLTTLSNNEIHVEVGIRPSPSAAVIYVRITKVGLLSNV